MSKDEEVGDVCDLGDGGPVGLGAMNRVMRRRSRRSRAGRVSVGKRTWRVVRRGRAVGGREGRGSEVER